MKVRKMSRWGGVYSDNFESPLKVGRVISWERHVWGRLTQQCLHTGKKSRRKTIITLRMLKDHLILSNYHIKLAVGDDSQFIYIHSLCCIHVAVYL